MKILRWIDKHFEHVILALLLIILTILSFSNVISRYVFRNGLSWSDEVCKYALVLSGFFSVPCWIRNNTGIRVDALTDIFPEKVQEVLLYITDIVMIIFLGFMTKGAADLVKVCLSVNQKSPALQIPMAYLYGLVTFAFMLSIFRYVQMMALHHVPAEAETAEGTLTAEEQAAMDCLIENENTQKEE